MTVGRTVLYRMSDNDLRRVQLYGSRGINNTHTVGQDVPMVVVRAWSDICVNGKVFLDGEDTLWRTSVTEGTDPGTWHWPERA